MPSSVVIPPMPIAGATTAPGTEAELADIVREAGARGQPLFFEGNGSKRHHGPAVSVAGDKVRRLSLRRLARVTAYDPADMVVSVQAGCRLADLQRTLGEHGQWLPLDPPYPAATIGGVLASASSGPRRLGYGTAKDLLLGLRMVGASGAITQSGGRVVKNVSGYDLHRLQVGAFGSLAVLLEAHFKVSARPAAQAVLLLGFASFEEALARLGAVATSALRPVALEALDAAAAAPLRESVPELPAAAALGLIGIEGAPAAIERHLRELGGLRSEALAAALLEGPAAERVWLALRDAAARTVEEVTLRVGARPRELGRLLARLRLETLGVHARSAHAGTGLARLRLPRAADLVALGHRIAAAHEVARAEGAYVVVEAAPLGVPGREALPWGSGPGLARRLKQAFDPAGILNPGRLPL